MITYNYRGIHLEPETKATPQSPGDGAQLYVKYRDDVPIAYAYGESWVAQALFMDDIGYPTEEEARLAWEQRQKMRKEVEEQLG